MQDSHDDLGHVVHNAGQAKASFAQLIDVELKVSPVHQVHNEAQVGLALIGVGQIDHKKAVNFLQDLLLQ